MSLSKPPPRDIDMTEMQHGKVLWVGYHGDSPAAEWPNDTTDTDKIKTVAGPWLPYSIENVQVELLSQGTWNRVFLIKNKTKHQRNNGPDDGFIFRLSLPVYPRYKTEAEAATIHFVRENTTIPAPKVYAFDSSPDNLLGYGWILMEKIPGVPYREVVDKLSLDDKRRISRSIAEWVDQLSQHRFDVIGSFYFAPGQRNKVELGRPVLQQFMGDWRHDYHHECGPFHDLRSFTHALIDCIGSEMFDPRQRLRAVIDAIRKEIWKLGDNLDLDDDDDGACDRTLEKLKLKQLEAEYAALLNSARV